MVAKKWLVKMSTVRLISPPGKDRVLRRFPINMANLWRSALPEHRAHLRQEFLGQRPRRVCQPDAPGRLIKEMRLESISSIEEANVWLDIFILDFNHGFAKAPNPPKISIGRSTSSRQR